MMKNMEIGAGASNITKEKVKKNFTTKLSTRTFMFELHDSVCLQ